MSKKNIIIYNTRGHYQLNCGGTTAQYYLGKLLDEHGCNVRIHARVKQIQNPIFNKFYNNDFPIDDNCIVIYGDVDYGNPLNAKKIVRWMLCELGTHTSHNIVNTWNKKELVYYFNNEIKISNNPEKIGSIYKMLSTLYISPSAINHNNPEREGYCFTVRKFNVITKKDFNTIKHIHPHNSFEINYGHTQEECIEFFNKYKYFISYDSITFFSIIAALCGCISIVYKEDGKSKEDWLKTNAAYEYLKSKNTLDLYGIAYGIEEIDFAISTIHLVKKQWEEISKFAIEKNLMPFINDINNFDSNINTIENNYF